MLHGAFQTLLLRYYSTFYHVYVAPLSSKSSSQRNLCKVFYLTKPPWNIVDTLQYSILYFVLPIRCPSLSPMLLYKQPLPSSLMMYDVAYFKEILKQCMLLDVVFQHFTTVSGNNYPYFIVYVSYLLSSFIIYSII